MLNIPADRVGERADVLLSRSLEDLTRSAAARLLEEGAVLLDGKPVKKNYKTQAGDCFTVTLPEPEPVEAIPQDIPLDVVYEDEDVIVVNKPVGMVVHPAAGHPDGTLVNALLYHCKNSLSGINGQLRPGIVHRIDRDTSGLIIAAKTTRPISTWPRSCRTTPCTGNTRPCAWASSKRTPVRWTPPSAATPPTARRWQWSAKTGGRP